jgi:hypothetical protein
MMVAFNVDAGVVAKIQGTEDQEKNPIVAKVKGTGKDGSLSIQVSGESSNPITAKVSGDASSPIAIAPISISPDLKGVMESLNLGSLISSIARLADGIKVGVSNDASSPIAISIGEIPVDLTISVTSPAQEQVFKVEIKGSVGGK